jgi:glycosyl transferase, family 25
MKAYCINLDRRADRLGHMAAQFAAAGMAFERVPAVDGQRPDILAATAASGLGLTGLRMSSGAYGCFQSHREVWRRLVASGDAHALVFEDDLVLAKGIGAYLGTDWVPPDADLVKLETFQTRLHRDAGPGLPALGRRLHRLRSRHVGTGCYLVSAPAAARLLTATTQISDPIDEALFNEKSALFATLVTYQMDPAPVMQGANQAPAATQTAAADWSASSIPDRFAAGQAAVTSAQEGSLARLRRRLREEIRARAQGTRYVVVPFG